MTKFIKTLIIINGLIIPAIVIIFLFVKLFEFIQNSTYNIPPEFVNQQNMIVQKGDTFLLQGLSYGNPEKIYNSVNYYINVSPKTYIIPRKISGPPINFEGGSYNDNTYVNLIFLDPDYNVIGKLLDKKAVIESITIPSKSKDEPIDTTVKNIGYLIAFEDTNNDKKLDWKDNYDLFISDLNGKKLTKVTENLDIENFSFINNNDEIFISYTERDKLRKEYKMKKFCIYNIKTKQIRILQGIEKEMTSIQQNLN